MPRNSPRPSAWRIWGAWEYNLGNDELSWSEEMFGVVGREDDQGAPSLDEAAELVAPDCPPCWRH